MSFQITELGEYKTRMGCKAVVEIIDPGQYQPIVGVIHGPLGTVRAAEWFRDGRFFIDRQIALSDIVGPWDEPEQVSESPVSEPEETEPLPAGAIDVAGESSPVVVDDAKPVEQYVTAVCQIPLAVRRAIVAQKLLDLCDGNDWEAKRVIELTRQLAS